MKQCWRKRRKRRGTTALRGFGFMFPAHGDGEITAAELRQAIGHAVTGIKINCPT